MYGLQVPPERAASGEAIHLIDEKHRVPVCFEASRQLGVLVRSHVKVFKKDCIRSVRSKINRCENAVVVSFGICDQ